MRKATKIGQKERYQLFHYRIYPTKEQEKKILFTLERCRLLYNRLLEERNLFYKENGRGLNYFQQSKSLTERKEFVPELNIPYAQVLQEVARRLDRAFVRFYESSKGSGGKGKPRIKREAEYNSFAYPQSSGFRIEGNKIRLAKIGFVRIKLHREMVGKAKHCLVVRKNGKYYVTISCQVRIENKQTLPTKVGVDLGLRYLAVTSDGEMYENAKYLRKSECKISQLRKKYDLQKKGSNRQKKTGIILAKEYERSASRRKDAAHKTSRKLSNNYGMVVFEDLNIPGLVKNSRLSKSILDAGWGQVIRFTQYKAEENGGVVVFVSPHNTSQICSSCGEIVKKGLHVRVHHCDFCGYIADRDENAARNILKRAVESKKT